MKLSGVITVPFHIGDFLSGTMHMDTLEKGAYAMLLFSHYQCGEMGLPNDDKKLSRICGVTMKVWLRIKPILSEKFVVSDDFWRHKKVIDVLQKVHDKSSKQRDKALKRNGSTLATAEPRQSQPKPKPKPKPIEKEDTNVSSKKQKSSSRGTRMTEDWFLSQELGEWAMQQGFTGVEVERQAEKFKDWWIAVAGAKGVKKDWDATWRTWIRNAQDWRK